MPIRVLIADDHPVLRLGICSYLSREADIQVVGEAENGDEVLPQVLKTHPDVLLLDIDMPGTRAVDILQALSEIEMSPEVLVFTAYSDSGDIKEIMGAGPRGYLLKGTALQDLLLGIRAVANKQTWLSPVAAEVLVQAMGREKEAHRNDILSSRECEVLNLAARGYSNRQIALTLSISERTARFHMESILKKLDVNNRTEAVAVASQRGCIDF